MQMPKITVFILVLVKMEKSENYIMINFQKPILPAVFSSKVNFLRTLHCPSPFFFISGFPIPQPSSTPFICSSIDTHNLEFVQTSYDRYNRINKITLDLL